MCLTIFPALIIMFSLNQIIFHTLPIQSNPIQSKTLIFGSLSSLYINTSLCLGKKKKRVTRTHTKSAVPQSRKASYNIFKLWMLILPNQLAAEIIEDFFILWVEFDLPTCHNLWRVCVQSPISLIYILILIWILGTI